MVERFEITHDADIGMIHRPHDHGYYTRHSDYAALEARCAELETLNKTAIAGWREAETVLTTLRARIEREPVVKALEWEEIHQRRSDEDPVTEAVGFEASNCFDGYYNIEVRAGDFRLNYPDNRERPDFFETEREAKAAAQADYERRILSALASAPERVVAENNKELIQARLDKVRLEEDLCYAESRLEAANDALRNSAVDLEAAYTAAKQAMPEELLIEMGAGELDRVVRAIIRSALHTEAIAPNPVAYRYRYTDPVSGNAVWRYSYGLWNGQKPSESQPLYASPPAPVVTEAHLIRAWTDFLDANPDDLNSPEDLPNHALMTGDQFVQYASAALEAALASREGR